VNRKQPIIDGEYYHVYNRGNDQREIFRAPGDYGFFMNRLRTDLPCYKVHAVVYVLLPNHYHMILSQESGGDLPSMMGTLATSYAHRFNLLYGRTGHLFEGPYKYKRIASREYLMHLVRYVHINPVFAGLARSPEDWPWSNYCQCIDAEGAAANGVVQEMGIALPPCDIRPLLSEFDGDPSRYKEFVRKYSEDQFMQMRRYLFDEP
jgi:putative transposase